MKSSFGCKGDAKNLLIAKDMSRRLFLRAGIGLSTVIISACATTEVAIAEPLVYPTPPHHKIQPPKEGTTANEALLAAVRNDDLDAVERSLKSGADIRARSEYGETVLHVVRSPVLAQFLIDHGADVNAREYEYQMTPIFFQNAKIIQLLYKAGADLNIKAKQDMTPLMWHTYSNHLAGVKFLIDGGAAVNAVNKEESTALDIALRFDYREMVDYLKSIGGKTEKELKP